MRVFIAIACGSAANNDQPSPGSGQEGQKRSEMGWHDTY